MRTRSTQFINNVNVYFVAIGCFKQLPVNFTLWNYRNNLINSGVRLSSDVVGGLILSADNPLDFYDEI